MKLNKSIIARAGKVRKQTPHQLSDKLKIGKKLQGRAGKRQQFSKFMRLSFIRKIYQQNEKSITRKGSQKRRIKTQMIKIFIKELK